MAAPSADKLAELVDSWHTHEEIEAERDDIFTAGYTRAQEEVQAILDGKGTAAVKLKAVRTWAEAD